MHPANIMRLKISMSSSTWVGKYIGYSYPIRLNFMLCQWFDIVIYYGGGDDAFSYEWVEY